MVKHVVKPLISNVLWKSVPPELSGFSRGSAILKNHCFKTGGGVPNATRYQLRYASIFQFFIYFRKWSNMWSSHLFRTFCRKVYRPNCQCCQGVQRFEKIYQGKPLWVSRTRRATNCATPQLFKFFSIAPLNSVFMWFERVDNQRCGQTQYFAMTTP